MNHLLDTNCAGAPKCTLRLGISQAYNSNSLQRRQGLKYHGYKRLSDIFDSPNGKKIFAKIKDRTEEAYPDVIAGKRRTIITSPPQFENNSKLTDTFSVVEEALEDIIAKKKGDENELKDIKQFRADYLPQAGERDVFNPLLSCFFHNPGLFIHGFEPSKYLNVFVQQAEMMRNEEFSRSIMDETGLWMKEILKLFPSKEPKRHETIWGCDVKNALATISKQNVDVRDIVMKTKSKFKDHEKYTIEDINAMLLSCLRSTSGQHFVRKPFKFNELEDDILQGLGKGATEIDTKSNVLLQEIKKQTTETLIKGEFVHHVIENDKSNSKSFSKTIKGKFKKEELYTEEEIKTAVAIAADVALNSSMLYGNQYDMEAFMKMFE